jgi:hypothetical protein
MSKKIQVRKSHKKQGLHLQFTRSEIADIAEADATYKRKLYDHRPIQGHDMPEYKDAGH